MHNRALILNNPVFLSNDPRAVVKGILPPGEQDFQMQFLQEILLLIKHEL